MAERPSDRAIAQAVRWASDELRTNGSDASIPLCAAVNLIVTKAIELDAAPSEPSAEHWRRAISDWNGDHPRDPDAAYLKRIEQRAREIAKEGK